MAIDRVRHGRQIRLPEIGEAGQERLGAARVVVGSAGDAGEVEEAYLRGAGVGVDANANADANADANAVVALGMQDPAARDVAEGAMRALLAMRRILGVGGEQ